MLKQFAVAICLIAFSSCVVWTKIKKNCQLTNDSTSSTYKACIVCDTSVASDLKKAIPELH